MRKLFLGLMTAGAVVILPQVATAEEPKGPGPFNPEVLFSRLDANHDGVITADEVPPGAPERLKQLLISADKNGDKKLTREELSATLKDRRPGPPADRAGPPQGRPGPGGPPARGPGRWGPPGPPPGGPPRAQGPWSSPGQQRQPGPPPQAPGAGPFDLKALFNKMDTNHDGALSLEEFTAGMKELRGAIAARLPALSGTQMPWRRGDAAAGPGPGWRGGPGAMQGGRPGFGPGPGRRGGPGAQAWQPFERGQRPAWYGGHKAKPKHHGRFGKYGWERQQKGKAQEARKQAQEGRKKAPKARKGDGRKPDAAKARGAARTEKQPDKAAAPEARIRELEARLKAIEAKLGGSDARKGARDEGKRGPPK